VSFTPADLLLAASSLHLGFQGLVTAVVYPSPGPRSWPASASVVAAALAVGITAAVAAPAHSRLGREGRSDDVLRRLQTADSVRFVAAIVGAIGALFAAG
jgi:hypothetical protein